MKYEWSRVKYGWSTSGVEWSRNSWSLAFSPLVSSNQRIRNRLEYLAILSMKSMRFFSNHRIEYFEYDKDDEE
jgi:hypothetical protein